jgi:hypothetical protein
MFFKVLRLAVQSELNAQQIGPAAQVERGEALVCYTPWLAGLIQRLVGGCPADKKLVN